MARGYGHHEEPDASGEGHSGVRSNAARPLGFNIYSVIRIMPGSTVNLCWNMYARDT